MGQDILKFAIKSGKSQENGIDISMKASFQILTVSVMMRLPSLAIARKKYTEIGERIYYRFWTFCTLSHNSVDMAHRNDK